MKVAHNIKAHILGSTDFFSESLTVCEIMWNNMEERGRPQTTAQYEQSKCKLRAG
jgi:hypothetical protein